MLPDVSASGVPDLKCGEGAALRTTCILLDVFATIFSSKLLQLALFTDVIFCCAILDKHV